VVGPPQWTLLQLVWSTPLHLPCFATTVGMIGGVSGGVLLLCYRSWMEMPMRAAARVEELQVLDQLLRDLDHAGHTPDQQQQQPQPPLPGGAAAVVGATSQPHAAVDDAVAAAWRGGQAAAAGAGAAIVRRWQWQSDSSSGGSGSTKP
jgi:hypothetical protein